MKKILLLFFVLSIHNLYGQSVLFGERDLSDTKLALYFDKEGSLYPSYQISDTSLEESNSSLTEWYSKHPAKFIEIAKKYHCTFSTYSLDNLKILNDSILESYTNKINATKSTKNDKITFLIHGFRKPFADSSYDTTSPKDFKILEQNIKKHISYKPQFVEVYWDAFYHYFNLRERKKIFRLFEKSRTNAANVGTSLKRVLLQIKHDTINIITHSLGAKVALYSLLNIDSSNSKTPDNNRINIALIAPAISGEMITENYYKRNTETDYKSKDNYRLFIAHNKHDFVLRKRKCGLGPGPYKYGNTTLGCNHKRAAIKTQKAFLSSFPNSKIQLFDFRAVGRRCHLVRCYCATTCFKKLIKKMNL